MRDDIFRVLSSALFRRRGQDEAEAAEVVISIKCNEQNGRGAKESQDKCLIT